MEPNNGAQVDSITVPGARQGAIGVANDLDVFTVLLTAGQQVRWTVEAKSPVLAPHLTISEALNTVPILVSRGSVGSAVTIEQLVLKTGNYAVVVRDSRNVPSASSQNVGSALHAYVLSSEASTRTPTSVLVPSTTNGLFANRYASALYRFTLATSTAVTVNVLAKSKAPASDLDTRLTIYNTTSNNWFGTNDDIAVSNTDSRLGGTLPPGDYLIAVDNLSETANDLSYQVSISSP